MTEDDFLPGSVDYRIEQTALYRASCSNGTRIFVARGHSQTDAYNGLVAAYKAWKNKQDQAGVKYDRR